MRYASGVVELSTATWPKFLELTGNRIGFDLGGSDRKCAAVIAGEVVFSEEVCQRSPIDEDG